jgi:replicative DNA helicase
MGRQVVERGLDIYDLSIPNPEPDLGLEAQLVGAMLAAPHNANLPILNQIPPKGFGRYGPIVVHMRTLLAAGTLPTVEAVTAKFRATGWPRDITQHTIGQLYLNAMRAGYDIMGMAPVILDQYERDEVIARTSAALAALQQGAGLTDFRARLTEDVVGFKVKSGESIDQRHYALVDEAGDSIRNPPQKLRHHMPGIPNFGTGHFIAVGGGQKGAKSAFATQYALNVAQIEGKKVLLCPLENRSLKPARDVVHRLANIPRHIEGMKLVDADLRRLDDAEEELKSLPIRIDDRSNIYDILRLCREYEPELLVIDQLSHITGIETRRDELRTYVYEQIMQLLYDQVCKSMGTQILMPFQLKRDATQRPTYRDAKDTAAIGAICDEMILIWRPNRKHEAVLIHELSRHGPDGIETNVNFNGQFGIFQSI